MPHRFSRADALRDCAPHIPGHVEVRARAARGVEVVLEIAALLMLVWLLGSLMPRLVSPAEEEPLPSQGCSGSSSAGDALARCPFVFSRR